jgi:serine/threonine protein phosphatase PrpC
MLVATVNDMANDQAAIETVAEAARSEQTGAAASMRRMTFDGHGMTDQGRVRSANEDQFAIAEVRRVLRLQQSSIAQPESLLGDPLGHLLMVADGMGGHQGGQYASAMALIGVENLLLNTVGWLCRLQGEGVLRELREALRTTDRWVDEAGGRAPELRGMGTTLTMVYATGSSFYVAHAGDSRCYLWRDRELRRLTRDHTLVQSLVTGGVLTPEEAAHHHMRNIVTNAVGGGNGLVEPDVHKHAALPGDVLLLCTDGLSNVLSDADIASVLERELTTAHTCRFLIDETNRRGGPDNVTTVVARFAAGEH